jgi:hypothetical protein
MRKPIRTILGMLLWFLGMVFMFLSLRQLVYDESFFVWLGHVGQALLLVLAGVALIPNTALQEFLQRTLSSK